MTHSGVGVQCKREDRKSELSPGLIATLKSYPLPKEGDKGGEDTASTYKYKGAKGSEGFSNAPIDAGVIISFEAL